MIITLNRYCQTKDCTLGKVTVGETVLHSLEDLPSFTGEKVPGKTRIKKGRYEVKFREILTPLTERYRKKYSWFNWHLELQNVPDFVNVYIHIGNYATNTDGCILVGKGVAPKRAMITESVAGFMELYDMVSKALLSGERVWIDIHDED